MVAPGRRDVQKDAAGGGLWRKIMGYLEAQLDKTPCPTHAVWRSPPETHHRTIMMLVTLIPKGSSGTCTSQPSMNTVATVDKNLRLALKAAKAAAAARQQGCGADLRKRQVQKEGDLELAHNHSHTQSQF